MAEVQAVNSSRALREAETRELATHPGEDLEDFVTFRVKKQLFGIPVLMVQDILSPDRIASIPLAPPEVRGSINLRGRIVTVIDVRVRLGLPTSTEASENAMAVTVEHDHELYTLLVDSIGDVVSLSNDLYERNPATLDSLWREFANGIYRLKGELMVVLDVHRLLNINVRL
ncbi:chemotaxis protein CheW [Thalassospiraceae bacterium LMO-SO8]|nr:chemotaxis protein CheW [Alphaproteobacteria bacterium LMO-S08]WND75666.1 chemotaxis protein CheW [Thalassospiraceae bacterium LMO-SO8]